MRIDCNQALVLSRQGKSYNEISELLSIPKSTLSCWFKDNPWSSEIKHNLTEKVRVFNSKSLRNKKQLHKMHPVNKRRWDEWHEQCRENARQEFPSLSDDRLFLAGLMLYWGKGDRVLRNSKVRLVNSNPSMIKLFYQCLIGPTKIQKEKILITLMLYPELEEKKYVTVWSRLLSIPISQFQKSAYIVGKHPTKGLSCGICTIEVRSRELKEKKLIWIELYQQYFEAKLNMLSYPSKLRE